MAYWHLFIQTLVKRSFLYLGDDTSHCIERQEDVSIILFNGQDKTIIDVLSVHGLMKKLLFVKKLDEVGGEIKSRRHILISLIIIANYMPKLSFMNFVPHHKIMLNVVTIPTTIHLYKTNLWHKHPRAY